MRIGKVNKGEQRAQAIPLPNEHHTYTRQGSLYRIRDLTAGFYRKQLGWNNGQELQASRAPTQAEQSYANVWAKFTRKLHTIHSELTQIEWFQNVRK